VSFAIDINILLYASDEVSPFASRARAFLDDCAAGREVLCVAWTTVMSYLRIATPDSGKNGGRRTVINRRRICGSLWPS
jgi:hypothetical protein